MEVNDVKFTPQVEAVISSTQNLRGYIEFYDEGVNYFTVRFYKRGKFWYTCVYYKGGVEAKKSFGKEKEIVRSFEKALIRMGVTTQKKLDGVSNLDLKKLCTLVQLNLLHYGTDKWRWAMHNVHYVSLFPSEAE